MKYLIIDGEFSTTGIKDGITKEIIEVEDWTFPSSLSEKIINWQQDYANEFMGGFKDLAKVTYLDNLGIEIAKEVSDYLKDTRVDYYSDAYLRYLYIGKTPKPIDEDEF